MVRLLNETVARRKVLIYGTGTTLAFRVLLSEGFDVTGADVGADVIQYWEREFPGRFVHASELETSERGFDVITACEVFEHLHDPPRWIRSLVRNLAADGVLCGSTNFYDGSESIEEPTGYMAIGGHVAYWSQSSLGALLRSLGLDLELFELVCPGSVKPDLMYGRLWPNKRLFFASRDSAVMRNLRALKASTPILPCDTSEYPVSAYRESN